MQFEKLLLLVPGLGMMLVAGFAVFYCIHRLRTEARWFWVGAGLWTIAVALKFACAILTNPAVVGFLNRLFRYPAYVAIGGLYVGVQSSIFEIGFTILAGWIWRQLGRDSPRAIAVGVGAGAFEAFLLGLLSAVAMAAVAVGAPGTEGPNREISVHQAVTPLFWLVAPVERISAVLVHASSRALVLLGLTYRRPLMVFWGFWIFALLDTVAGAAQLSGRIGTFSLWWVELAILPFGLISIPILRWCIEHFPRKPIEQSDPGVGSGEVGESQARDADEPQRVPERPTCQPGNDFGSSPAGGGSTSFS